MNGSISEKMDISPDLTITPVTRKSPQSSNISMHQSDFDGVTENGHHYMLDKNGRNSGESDRCTIEKMDVDQDDESGDGSISVDQSENRPSDNSKSTNKAFDSGRNDPLAESSNDSFNNSRHTGDKSNTVHSTTNLGETENSNDSSSISNPAQKRMQNANNCLINNDSINSDSIDSSHLKHKGSMATDSDEEGIVHEIQSDSDNEQDKPVMVNDEDSDDEVDSEEDSSDDEISDITEGMPDDVSSGQEEGPLSIHSDSEPESDNNRKNDMNKSSEVLLIDDASNQGNMDKMDDKQKSDGSDEIHEIASDNDDCILTDDKTDDGKKSDSSKEIRRSSRIHDQSSFSSKNYDLENDDEDDESDIEEIIDPLNQGMKSSKSPIVISNTKKLVDLALIKQNGKSNSSGQKKEPTVVIIDTNSILTGKTQVPVPPKVPFSNLPPQALYESMAARGTTVTPLSTKPSSTTSSTSTSSTSTSSTASPVILPSLTDDMFVVEAPSFIVPYVYEKPSIKPFREFVDILGKELEEQIRKEEKEKQEKEREIREKLELENKDKPKVLSEKSERLSKKIRSMDIGGEDDLDPKSKSSRKGRRKKKDDDDASWDGESTSDSEDDGISDDERTKTVIIKEKDDDSLDAIKDPMITDLTGDSSDPSKPNSYFDNSLGKFFINIGMNLVQEFVQTDLLRQQRRKLQREHRSGSGNVKATECAINSLLKNLELSKENNAPYKAEPKKCDFCNFKTESLLALSHHLETPHMKNGVYKCNFCAFEVRSPHDILFHMEAEHNIRGRLERAPQYHQCPNCSFEDNGKGKLGRHLISCAKKFKPEHNLMPPVDWEPPAKIPKAIHVRQNVVNSYQNVFAKMQAPHLQPNILSASGRGRGRPQMLPSLKPLQGNSLVRAGGGVMYRQNNPQQMLLSNYQMKQGSQQSSNTQLPKILHQPSISITPLPRTNQGSLSISSPVSNSSSNVNNASGQNKSFVICEICDGYIKDLEQLRNHMQWIHKVKIHPKMIYNRPPLNCQKCQFRFFTDQGLERHLLGSHGLVTSSMQEAANKGKDAGRCPICGRVYQWKLLNHVARDHGMTLKPAHLSYKCTVCTATFGMYRQFENHVYSAHSVVAKRAVDKNKNSSAPASSSKVTVTPGGSLLKPIN